jgi:hypothetical protein
MITRSNLAEQLRDYQLRSQQNWASLTFFSATANIASRSVLFCPCSKPSNPTLNP